jgi:hypothetical protein
MMTKGRTLSPLVWQRWAWWNSRWVVAVASVFKHQFVKAGGAMQLELIAANAFVCSIHQG